MNRTEWDVLMERYFKSLGTPGLDWYECLDLISENEPDPKMRDYMIATQQAVLDRYEGRFGVQA